MTVPRIPEGQRSVTPHVTVEKCAQALEFYKKAFGAEEICRCAPDPACVYHAELRIGDSSIYLNDPFPDWGVMGPDPERNSPVSIHLAVEDADAMFAQAVAAGCTPEMPPMDQFWGDRYAKVKCPYGHRWGISHHIEDVAPEELNDRAIAWMKQMAEGGGHE